MTMETDANATLVLVGLASNTSLPPPPRLVPPYWAPLPTLLFSATILCFMACAIIGNSMVVGVIARHRGMRTRTNLFLCSLAVADLLTALLLMPVALVTMVRGEWVFGAGFCQLNGFLLPLLFVASIHTLMYISVHKYASIAWPFTRGISRRHVTLAVGAAWCWALLTGYVTVHGLNSVLYKPATTQCGPAYPHDARTRLHPVYMTLTCYLLPFGVMTFCYARIFWEMRAHAASMLTTSSLQRDVLYRQQMRITGTLIVVMSVFVVSWTPYVVYSFYVSGLKDKEAVPTNLNAISYWFGYMNSACNPIIYALRSPAFWNGYKELWCRMPNVISSEATETTNQHSTFRRLQVFIQNSLHLRTSLSMNSLSGTHATYSGTRKVSAGSIAQCLLRPLNRKTSTSSLPESFRYATGSLPRTSNMRKHTSFALPVYQSAAYYPDSYKTLSPGEYPGDRVGPVSVFNVVEDYAAEKTTGINGDPVVVHGLGVDVDGMAMSYSSKDEPDFSPHDHKVERDHVVVVVGELKPNDAGNSHQKQPSSSASFIEVREEKNKSQIMPTASIKKEFQQFKNVHGTEARQPEKTPALAQLLVSRSSSDANISMRNDDDAAAAASSGLFRSFLKSLQSRSRDRLYSMSSSTKSRKSSSRGEEATPVRTPKRTSLNVPRWRSLLRSLSEDTHGRTTQDMSGQSGIYKVASDSHIMESNRKRHCSNQRKHKKLKRGDHQQLDVEMDAASAPQIEEGQSRLQRAWSEKPHMLRCLSVEKLDQKSRSLSLSLTPTQKKRKKKSYQMVMKKDSRQKLILRSESSDVQTSTAAMMNVASRSTNSKDSWARPIDTDNLLLQRSWSDPCMNFKSLEHKVSIRRQMRQDRRKTGQSPSIQKSTLVAERSQ